MYLDKYPEKKQTQRQIVVIVVVKIKIMVMELLSSLTLSAFKYWTADLTREFR